MSTRPLDEDVFVCRWRDRLHEAVKNDADAAKFARFMHGIADKIEISLRTDASSESARHGQSADERFHGFPLVAKHGGRCVVCGRGFHAGANILWQREAKQAAHAECGAVRR